MTNEITIDPEEIRKLPNESVTDVRNSIQERIKTHEKDIQNCLDTIKKHGDWTKKIKLMTELIDNSKIRISELRLVLEYCF